MIGEPDVSAAVVIEDDAAGAGEAVGVGVAATTVGIELLAGPEEPPQPLRSSDAMPHESARKPGMTYRNGERTRFSLIQNKNKSQVGFVTTFVTPYTKRGSRRNHGIGGLPWGNAGRGLLGIG